ncbi:polyketide synthase [Seiridium cupressi]
MASTHPSLLVFSANDEESLGNAIKDVEEFYIREQPSLDDLAHTLGSRGQHLPHRAFAIAESAAPFDVTRIKTTAATRAAAPVFLFSGQGAQWPGMGKELMAAYDSYLQDIRAMDSHLASLEQPPAFSIENELQKPASTNLLDKAQYSDPTSIALQVALVNLLRSWGIEPSAVIGHSSGDQAAAYAAGILTMEEAITISHYRGLALQSRACRGGMAAIGLGASELVPHLPPTISIGCVNSGRSVTISGDKSALESFIRDLKKIKPDVFARTVPVEMAYHSPHTQAAGEVFQQLLEGCITPKEPSIPYYSTVKDKFMTEGKELGPSYWVDNLVSPVLFYSGVKAILDCQDLAGNPHLEIGPCSALSASLKHIYKEVGIKPQYLSVLIRDMDARRSIFKAVGQLFSAGADVDFHAMNPKGTTLMSVPGYG